MLFGAVSVCSYCARGELTVVCNFLTTIEPLCQYAPVATVPVYYSTPVYYYDTSVRAQFFLQCAWVAASIVQARAQHRCFWNSLDQRGGEPTSFSVPVGASEQPGSARGDSREAWGTEGHARCKPGDAICWTRYRGERQGLQEHRCTPVPFCLVVGRKRGPSL
jgi:hypothetical protein